MAKISILGNGSWGGALAKMWAMHGNDVRVWDKGMDMHTCTRGAEIIVNAVPSHATREVARVFAPFFDRKQVIVNAAKGLEEGTYLTLTEVITSEINTENIAAMSGPSHAEEVAENIPTTNIIASKNETLTKKLQQKLSTPTFRLYAGDDVKGVQLAGCLKNVIAICSGISDGLKYGDNTRAALITRGIVEMIRLGIALDGQQKTFLGLAGIGDCIVTATSRHSRNYNAGLLIGQGKSVEEAITQVTMVVEGVKATKVAYELANKHNIDCPIINEAYQVIYNKKPPKQAVGDLMTRELKWE